MNIDRLVSSTKYDHSLLWQETAASPCGNASLSPATEKSGRFAFNFIRNKNMNKFTFDSDGGFLLIETKWGTICIEQSMYETSVILQENLFQNHSHVENLSYKENTVICLVSDNKPED